MVQKSLKDPLGWVLSAPSRVEERGKNPNVFVDSNLDAKKRLDFGVVDQSFARIVKKERGPNAKRDLVLDSEVENR